MANVSEMLAAQLRAPGFRTTEPGYDADHVRDHLAVVHGLVTTLERRIEDVLAQAVEAEAVAVRAEAEAPVTAPAPEDDELLSVVFDGQRRADEVVAQAEAEAARLQREADARIAALRDESDMARLRLEVERVRTEVGDMLAAVAVAREDVAAAGEATRRCRETVGERLAAALADLAEMEHA